MTQATSVSDLFGGLHDAMAEIFTAEHRARERHDFRYLQRVAPFDGQSLPEADAFFQVHCHDLSPQGFSFLAAEVPACTALVVALGKEPYIHVVARVVRVSDKRANDGLHLIGCQFERRL
jgi:hypothetical protein